MGCRKEKEVWTEMLGVWLREVGETKKIETRQLLITHCPQIAAAQLEAE